MEIFEQVKLNATDPLDNGALLCSLATTLKHFGLGITQPANSARRVCKCVINVQRFGAISAIYIIEPTNIVPRHQVRINSVHDIFKSAQHVALVIKVQMVNFATQRLRFSARVGFQREHNLQVFSLWSSVFSHMARNGDNGVSFSVYKASLSINRFTLDIVAHQPNGPNVCARWMRFQVIQITRHLDLCATPRGRDNRPHVTRSDPVAPKEVLGDECLNVKPNGALVNFPTLQNVPRVVL